MIVLQIHNNTNLALKVSTYIDWLIDWLIDYQKYGIT